VLRRCCAGYCVLGFFALRGRERLENELAEAFFEADAYAAQDYITGVANRRTFDSQLKQEWNRMLREHGTLSMLMIDVDHFKLYNDFYGHMAGDECLRKIGSILAGVQRRGGDFVARFGGEEFAVLLPRAYSQGATTLAERIRQSVRDACLQHSPYQAGIVTISVGVGTLQAEESKDEKLLIERADQALISQRGREGTRWQSGRMAWATEHEAVPSRRRRLTFHSHDLPAWSPYSQS